MIKRAEKNDAKILSELAHEIWREHYTPIIGESDTEYMLSEFQTESAIKEQISGGLIYYLMLDDFGEKTPCGYFAYELEKEDIYLSKLYVKKEYRGKGYAKKSVEHILNEAKKADKKTVYVYVNKHNTNSMAAYQRLGFVRGEARKLDIGGGHFMDDYRYILSVSGIDK